MANSTHQQNHPYHISENVRNTVIFILIFGLIAAISYFEWAGRLGY